VAASAAPASRRGKVVFKLRSLFNCIWIPGGTVKQ
jgi:hypothetical protein